VRAVIKKSIFEFLLGVNFCEANCSIAWKEELESRKHLLKVITEKKLQIQNAENKKAIDLLKVTKQIAQIPRNLTSNNLVMALGEDREISCYVPESTFYDAASLIHKLSYKELKCYRYRHIDPVKIYESEDEHLEHIQMPRVKYTLRK
jgi:hypothetical protein